MQVERFNNIADDEDLSDSEAPLLNSGGRVSNTWATYLQEGDNREKFLLIPHKTTVPHGTGAKDLSLEDGLAAD